LLIAYVLEEKMFNSKY